MKSNYRELVVFGLAFPVLSRNSDIKDFLEIEGCPELGKQLVIDMDKCTGCRMCEMACSLEKEGECNRAYSRIRVVKLNEGIDVPTVCLQCEDPGCEKVCPVKAITRDSNGAFVIDYESCVGCKKCLTSCPIGAVWLDPRSKKIIKCDLCNGDPTCVKFCQPKAIDFIQKETVDTVKMIAARNILDSTQARKKLKRKT
jgi:carbon-monoxide dehydrogenase iron sulfur subunit